MKQDRFLTGILIGISVLVILALGLFFLRQDKREYASEANPEGVAHNYVLALLDHDYEKAYSYLADLEHKPTYEEFRQSFFNGVVNYENVGLEVGDVQVNGDEAIVNVMIYYSYNDPFSGRNGTSDRALLVEQNGEWKLSSMPYNFWDYNWYQEPYKP